MNNVRNQKSANLGRGLGGLACRLGSVASACGRGLHWRPALPFFARKGVPPMWLPLSSGGSPNVATPELRWLPQH